MAKLPSGRFPFINLAKAIGRAKSIFENDRGGKGLRMPVAFSAWGYSDKSSGGFQTVAALKQYGLLVDEGSHNDRSVKLTEEARRYFQTEIDADRQKLEHNFALHPALMKHLFTHWEGGLVDDPVARTYLKTEIGLNEQSARSALGIYKENLSYVQGTGDSKRSEPEGEIGDSNRGREGVVYGGARVGDLIDYESGGAIANSAPLRVRALSPDQSWVFVEGSEAGLQMEQVIVRERPDPGAIQPPTLPLGVGDKGKEAKPLADGYRSETFDTDEGAVEISWPSNLSTQSVEDMQSWVELLMKRIERRAKAGGDGQ